MSWIKNFLQISFITIVLFVAIDFAVTSFHGSRGFSKFFVSDSVEGRKNKPGFSATFGSPLDEFKGLVSIGLNGERTSFANDCENVKNTTLFIGDSTTAGFEVNDDVAAKYEPIEIPDPEIPSDDNHESNDDSGHESNHADDEVSEEMEAPPKKGGKKKMIIALVVLLLAGGGAGAYFMGAMGGGHSSDPAQAAENEGDAESSESLISDSAGTEITADSVSVDSNTVNNDSVLVDSALVETEE